MSERTDIDFLSHIREAVQRITAYTATMRSVDFFKDIKTQDAVVRNLEIIEEAAKNLSERRSGTVILKSLGKILLE